jgi:serine O-acetyltransferase
MRTEAYNLNGEQIIIPIAESYHDCMTLIKSDYYRVTGKTESSVAIIRRLFNPLSFKLQIWFRLCQYKGFLYPFCRYMYLRVSDKSLVVIPSITKVGYGLRLSHGIGIVVNAGTIIGNNVNLSQFVNIGTNNNTPAIIGDNVYIGPHVSIVEDVKIGSNSTVGAGAVVTRDVPENATVVGCPAKVINFNHPGKYITRRWPISQ